MGKIKERKVNEDKLYLLLNEDGSRYKNKGGDVGIYCSIESIIKNAKNIEEKQIATFILKSVKNINETITDLIDQDNEFIAYHLENYKKILKSKCDNLSNSEINKLSKICLINFVDYKLFNKGQILYQASYDKIITFIEIQNLKNKIQDLEKSLNKLQRKANFEYLYEDHKRNLTKMYYDLKEREENLKRI